MANKLKPSGRKGRPLESRHVNTRAIRPRFLIVCEGKETEPNYFRSFRVNAVIEVVGKGKNTLSLVKHACTLKAKDDYNFVWCVFDRDNFSAEQFNAALDLARQNDICAAYSNEAFELWYLLHFDYWNTAVSRSSYCDKLTERLEMSYRKNDLGMYERLLARRATAIQNAQRLLAFYGPDHNPEHDNPCTTVHHLVQKLNLYLR